MVMDNVCFLFDYKKETRLKIDLPWGNPLVFKPGK